MVAEKVDKTSTRYSVEVLTSGLGLEPATITEPSGRRMTVEW